MDIIKRLSVFLVSALLALPAAAIAQEGLEGIVTAGGAVVDLDDESFKYGEYSRVKDDMGYLLLDADLSYNRGAFYLDLMADDVGLEKRTIYLETGRYGNYKLFLGYEEIPKLISNTSKTPFNGAGGAFLTLPPGFVTAPTTPAMTITGVRDVDLETKRKAGTAGFSKSVGENMDFSLIFKAEEKEGTKSIGGTVRQAGGGPQGSKSAVLPEPVDYRTDELRSRFGYSDEQVQLEFEYYLSLFDNKEESLTWENPFFDAGYVFGPDAQFARLSLPPDNRHYGFTLSGGVNLPHFTRVSVVAGYGKMEQDETLLPYTVNPAITITTPLPRNSAEAEIDVTHLMLNASSRPMPKLGLSASYRFYKTDNKTPKDLFLRVSNDTGSQAAISDSQAAFNLPYDYTQNQIKLDASYYLLRGTTLKLGYDYDVYDRDFREVEKTRENTYRARLTSNFSRFASGSGYLSYGEKRIDGDYEEARLFDAIHTDDYITACTSVVPADCFDNHHLLRKYDIADRDRLRYGANLSFFPGGNTTVGLYYDHNKDDYEDSVLGITEDEDRNYTVDAAYSPADFVSLYAFYTREELESSIAGHSFTAAGPPGTKSTQAADPARKWWADIDDDIDTVGLGTSLGFMKDRLTISADYSFSESTGEIKFRAGSALTAPEDMPELKTRIHTLNVTGKYGLSKKTKVGLGYQYENYESDDWATDNFDPASTTLSNVLTLSGSIPDYEAHLVMVFLSYNFGVLPASTDAEKGY